MYDPQSTEGNDKLWLLKLGQLQVHAPKEWEYDDHAASLCEVYLACETYVSTIYKGRFYVAEPHRRIKSSSFILFSLIKQNLNTQNGNQCRSNGSDPTAGSHFRNPVALPTVTLLFCRTRGEPWRVTSSVHIKLTAADWQRIMLAEDFKILLVVPRI